MWAAIKRGQPIARRADVRHGSDTVATVVQVTNLGITVKDSPQNTLVFVTRLDTGVPVGGADVSIIRSDNSVAWSGRTDADGVALAPALQLRDARARWEFKFIVTAAKDGDVAYVGSDWNEGIEPYAVRPPLRPRAKRRRCCAARCSATAASTSSARRCTSRRSCAATRRPAFR